MDICALNLNHLRLSLALVWMLTSKGLAQHQPNERAVTEDYCMSEPFQPRCLKSDVLVMRSATYGRMRIGRCIPAEEIEAHRAIVGDDPRYFGCSMDVLHLLHRKCSGLAECDIRLSEISANNIKPCFPGLTVYLDVSYQCINVADDERSCSLLASSDPIHIHVIGSSVSKRRTCGTKSQPWIVEAPVGQRLRLSLLDFTASTEDNTRGQRKESCINYGVIIDKEARRNVTICGGGGGQHGSKELYTSRGNAAEIILNEIDENLDSNNGKRFMIIVSSVGCSDLIPPEDAWLKRSEDTIVIGCYASRQTWHLNCQEGNWVGVFGNCSQGLSANDIVSESELIKVESWTDGQVLVMVSIGGLTVAVCFAILCAGIICFRRFSVQKQKNHSEYKTINYTMTSSQRQQTFDERNSQNAATALDGNGLSDFGTQLQMPNYSVFVGENGFSDAA